MFLAETTTTATSTNLFNIISVAMAVLGALAFISAYFYVTLKKGERDYDKDTIRSLTENNTALRTERDSWKEQALTAEGKNKVLQEMVTAAPAIAKLGKQMSKEHKDSVLIQEKIVTALTKLIEGESK